MREAVAGKVIFLQQAVGGAYPKRTIGAVAKSGGDKISLRVILFDLVGSPVIPA